MKRMQAFGVALALSFMGGVATAATCQTRPSHAFNGQVPITYPSGGSASVVRICDASINQARDNMYAKARASGVALNWVEFYVVKNWGATFHDLIYKTRSLGFSQADYQKYNLGSRSDEILVYTNASNSRYIGMVMRDQGPSTTTFILYGN